MTFLTRLLFCSCYLWALILNSSVYAADVPSSQPAHEVIADGDNEEEIDEGLPNDPLEPLNRVIFGINQSFDAAILRPVTHAYIGLIPAKGRKAVGNFLQNLTEPISLLNHGFQQNGNGMKVTVVRFFLNTFMGFFGLFDVAKECGYDVQKQGFMDTLAKAGLGPGPYLVLPLFGPSNFRDAAGLAADWVYDPVYYVLKNQNKNLPYFHLGMKAVDLRASVNDLVDSMNKSVDPYARYRLLYSEYRRGQNANVEEYDAPVPDNVQPNQNTKEDQNASHQTS